MDFKIGIEMREEYKRLETARGALKFMRDFMLVKPGENVVFNYDTCVDERVVRALAEATYSLDASPVVVYTPTGRGFYGKAGLAKLLRQISVSILLSSKQDER